MNLNGERELIRAIDEEMASLFVKRMEAVKAIAAYKREHGLPVEDTTQEARILKERSALIGDETLRPFYVQFLRSTIEVSKRLQYRLMEGLRVAYRGVEGAFAHIAAKHVFPSGTLVPFSSLEDAYAAVENGRCDVAVLPIENSYAGEVGQVIDLMFFGKLYVNGIYNFPAAQNLPSVPGAAISGVRTVASHPQALTQCRDYIQKHGFVTRGAANTAMAAQAVAEAADQSAAAIASEETAALYDPEVLDRDINESRTNTTCFAVFSRVENRPAQRQKGGTFLLLFTVKDEVGGLAKAVNLISAYNFNIRVLRSRPMKDLPWRYYFYVEAEGDNASENGQRMIAALRGVCPRVKVVGCYTASDNDQQGGGTI